MNVTLTNKDKRALLRGMADGVLDLESVPAIAQALDEARTENPFFEAMKQVFQDDDKDKGQHGITLI